MNRLRYIPLLALPVLAPWQKLFPGDAIAPAAVTFEDTAERSGIDFVLRNSATPERHQIETMVSGVAVCDFDNDGRPDIYFVNGALQPALGKPDPSWWNRLYHNEGSGRFKDVTERAGVKGEGFATGVACGDFDNDGFVDLFVAGVNRNILYRNRGDGTFEDITARSGLAGPAGKRKPWSVAAGWFDYDNDGRLDLFVVNYVVWDPQREPFCGNPQEGIRAYCHPKYYDGLPNSLYHNNGDGTFTDVSVPSGIATHIGKGMSVSFADYDHDGRLDVFVTNDTTPNFLFHNEGGGRFREVGLSAGVAFNEDGRALSSMGSDFRDIDNDGREDIFLTALANETFPWFRNLGGGSFADMTYPSGLGRYTLPLSGWSCGIFDLNNDGFKDIFTSNGDVNDNTEAFSSRHSRQPASVFLNVGNGAFVEGGTTAGVTRPAMNRGAAFGDLDGDGRIDVVVSRIGERAAFWRNTSPLAGHWLELRLRGRRSNRDGIGARVHLTGVSGREQWNHVTTSTGYGCSSDRMVHFGLGRDETARSIEILWPSGIRQVLEGVRADRVFPVEEPE